MIYPKTIFNIRTDYICIYDMIFALKLIAFPDKSYLITDKFYTKLT